MSSLTIEERFTLEAPAKRVFDYLKDPERVVVCLPGASIDERTEEGDYKGSIKVKLGTASIAYKGTMRFLEVDEENFRVRLEGKGRERSGGGSVKMTMESQVIPTDGGCEVVVESEVQLAGKIVRFARGMIQNVAQEVFRQFTACLATMVETDGADDGSSADEVQHAVVPAELSAFGLLLSAVRSWLARLFGREGGRP